MPSATPLSLAARERLRDHHVAATKAVARHAAALRKLEAATSRKADVLAHHDALVANVEHEVARAVEEVARVMGTEVAASVLGLSKAEVRHMATVAQ